MTGQIDHGQRDISSLIASGPLESELKSTNAEDSWWISSRSRPWRSQGDTGLDY